MVLIGVSWEQQSKKQAEHCKWLNPWALICGQGFGHELEKIWLKEEMEHIPWLGKKWGQAHRLDPNPCHHEHRTYEIRRISWNTRSGFWTRAWPRAVLLLDRVVLSFGVTISRLAILICVVSTITTVASWAGATISSKSYVLEGLNLKSGH